MVEPFNVFQLIEMASNTCPEPITDPTGSLEERERERREEREEGGGKKLMRWK